VSQKKQDTLLLPITSPNVRRLSKFFQLQTQQSICNELIIKDLAAPLTCRYITFEIFVVECPVSLTHGGSNVAFISFSGSSEQ